MSHYDDQTYKFLVESWESMKEDEFSDVDYDLKDALDYIIRDTEDMVYWIPSAKKAIIASGQHYEDENVKGFPEAGHYWRGTGKRIIAKNKIQQPAYGLSVQNPDDGEYVAAIGDLPDLIVKSSKDVESFKEAYTFYKEYIIGLAKDMIERDHDSY